MNEHDLRRSLGALRVPGEEEAAERSRRVVLAAFAEREPSPARARRLRPVVALAAALALLAAAVTPPGRAVLTEVRETIGVARSEPALFALPAPGRLLVAADSGSWVAHADGSKRALRDGGEAAWSPHGLFVVAAAENELAALELDGDVRWKLARRGASRPRWGGSRTDTRIAYLSAGSLRVVAGDGTGDRALAPAADVAPAWRPGERHQLAYAGADGTVRIVAADAGRELARWTGTPEELLWTADGSLLVARRGNVLEVRRADGRRVEAIGTGSFAGRPPYVAATAAPASRELAVVVHDAVGARSEVRVLSLPSGEERRIFEGPGMITDVEWSPDGRWLLVAWQDADQWLFVRTAGRPRLRAVSGIARGFESSRFPRVAGWVAGE